MYPLNIQILALTQIRFMINKHRLNWNPQQVNLPLMRVREYISFYSDLIYQLNSWKMLLRGSKYMLDCTLRVII